MALSRTAITVWTAAVLFLGILGSGMGFLYGQAFSNAIAGNPRSARLPVATDRAIPTVSLEQTPFFSSIFGAIESFAAAPITTNTERNMISIPAIDVYVPIAISPTMEDKDVLATLSKGVVMYPNGIEPGQPGLTFISGHSTGESWHGAYRFAFLRLNELQPGDVIHVDYNGSRYTYRVTGTRTINPKVVQSIDATADTPLLSLMTCWPLWSTKNRLIVDSEFIARNPLIVASDASIDSI